MSQRNSWMVLLAAAGMLLSTAAQAQDYPTKPITLIVPWPAGGSTDINLPMIGMWVQLLRLPYNVLFPLIILFTIIGVYCSSNNVFDVHVMIAFGVIGYFMRKLGYEPAPLVLAFVLGPMLENNLRKSLILSQGDLWTFVQRPISAVCLALALVLLIAPLLPTLRKKRELVALDEGA